MNTPSTANLSLIPTPTDLQRICKSISTLEAIICPEWEFRYYSYQKDWSETEEVFQMRNGQGDQMLILFSREGACINGFVHESKVNRVTDGLPEIFNEFIFGEPVKSIGTTFCIWRTKSDKEWKTGKLLLPNNDLKDGSSDLLHILDANPATYKEWAEEYYEEEFEESELKLDFVEIVYDQAILTKALAMSINPALEDLEKLKSDLEEIGYQNDL